MEISKPVDIGHKTEKMKLVEKTPIEIDLPLAVCCFPKILVKEKINLGMNWLERFIIKAALQLRKFSVEEFENITGVSENYVPRFASRILRSGAISFNSEKNIFSVENLELVRELDKSQEIFEFKERQCCFLYFPDREYALIPLSGVREYLENCSYEGQFSLKTINNKNINLREMFKNLLREGKIESNFQVSEILNGEIKKIPDKADYYSCKGYIKKAKNGSLIIGKLKFLARGQDNEQNLRVPGEFPLTEAEKDCIKVLKKSSSCANEIFKKMTGVNTKLDLKYIDYDLPHINFNLSKTDINNFKKHINLSRIYKIIVSFPKKEISLKLFISFEPRTEAAEEKFVFYAVINELIESNLQSKQELTDFIAKNSDKLDGLTEDELMDILWDNKCYKTIYQIRKGQDFSYE